MFLAIAFALLAVTVGSYQQQIPHILITTNVHNQHDVHKLCRVARQSQYGGLMPTEFGPASFHQASESSKATSRVKDCCDRTSTSGKQQCLQNVRNDMMMSMCDQSSSGLCCGCEGLQKRMCITPQNPMYPSYAQAGAFDFIDNQQNQDAYYGADQEDINQMMITNQCHHHSPAQQCMNCNKCQQQVERETQAAANQICMQSMIQGSQNVESSCCQAGASVGASAGQSHTNVCMPAAQKLQRKTFACGAPQNPNCAHVFVQCCQAASAAAHNQQNQFEQQMQENYEDVVEQASYAPIF